MLYFSRASMRCINDAIARDRRGVLAELLDLLPQFFGDRHQPALASYPLKARWLSWTCSLMSMRRALKPPSAVRIWAKNVPPGDLLPVFHRNSCNNKICYFFQHDPRTDQWSMCCKWERSDFEQHKLPRCKINFDAILFSRLMRKAEAHALNLFFTRKVVITPSWKQGVFADIRQCQRRLAFISVLTTGLSSRFKMGWFRFFFTLSPVVMLFSFSLSR